MFDPLSIADLESLNPQLFIDENDGEFFTESKKPKKLKVKDIVKGYFAEPPKEEKGSDYFSTLSLSRPVLKAISALGFVQPTEIQARAIPLGLAGKDLCASAVTGSGKTASFMIPIIERLLFRPMQNPAIRVLVLVPTRELGVQCQQVAQKLAQFTSIETCLCVGGLPFKSQEVELRKNPDIVIATTGRLIDHIHNSVSFSLDNIEILVIDEADRFFALS